MDGGKEQLSKTSERLWSALYKAPQKPRERRGTLLGTEGETTVYTERGSELQSEVSEVVHCVEKEDMRGNLIHSMEGGRQGDTSGTISGSYAAALYGAWWVWLEKSLKW